ncbi:MULTISPECIES: hypothetical protein [unclassified Mesorhizobium]|nr:MULTISPECIES: hypothetical protein [unclassified Mesorhizobium]
MLAVPDAGQYDFAIVRRRWIAGETGTTLEVTLDHPARSGGH